jgi:hypothetical protein
MKKTLLVTLCVLYFCSFVQAGANISEYYLDTKLNGASKFHGNYSMGTSFDNSDLGTITSTSATLVIDVVGIKTYQTDPDNIGGGEIQYRVYKQGFSPGSFIYVNLPYFGETSGTNPRTKEWQTGTDINLLSGVTSVGTYIVECYFKAYSPDIYESNGGFNFKATFTTTVALSAELGSFFARYLNGDNELVWITYSEKNNVHYEVERSNNSSSFNKLGQVASKSGAAESVRNYTFVDATPLSGINYYRLKMVDNDGKSTYSKVVSVNNVGKAGTLALTPNPAKDALSLVLTTDRETTASIQVVDMLGRTVLTEKRSLAKGDNSLTINISALSNGTYLLYANDSLTKFQKQ